jgi:hypothetical protein
MGRTVLTEVICNYVDIPWILVNYWWYGNTEPGSSGSPLFKDPLFTDNYKVIGALSGSISSCNQSGNGGQLGTTYGDFRNFYLHSKVRNALNPNHKISLDYGGIPSRRITCKNNLENMDGILWDFGGHQPQNQLTLTARDGISNSGDLRVVAGADYIFNAGDDVNFDSGFQVDLGASVQINSGNNPCQLNQGNYRLSAPNSEAEVMGGMLNEITSVTLPDYVAFDIETYLNPDKQLAIKNSLSLQVYPNPVQHILSYKLSGADLSPSTDVVIFNNFGQQLMKERILSFGSSINIENLSPGIYYIKVINNTNTLTTSFIKQ